MEAVRQTKGSSLQQALNSLTEDGQRVLDAASGLERRLTGNLTMTKVEGPTPPPAPKRLNEPPLLDHVEEQIRKVLGQIRAAGDILVGIERELS